VLKPLPFKFIKSTDTVRPEPERRRDLQAGCRAAADAQSEFASSRPDILQDNIQDNWQDISQDISIRISSRISCWIS
jgi:hypothetical protein